MPSGSYYRTQAQLFVRLALATSDPKVAARYNALALENLAKAEEVEPTAGQVEPGAIKGEGGGDVERD